MVAVQSNRPGFDVRLVFHERVPKLLTSFRLGDVDQSSVCQFLLQFGGNTCQPIRYGFIGDNRPVFPVVNQRLHQVFKPFDGLVSIRPAAQLDGVAAAIFAPLYIVPDNLTGSSVNCECCHSIILLSFGNPRNLP